MSLETNLFSNELIEIQFPRADCFRSFIIDIAFGRNDGVFLFISGRLRFLIWFGLRSGFRFRGILVP